MLTPYDLERYAQHLRLNNIGHSGQLKLKASKVLCIGLGGLGTPICLYLANAGIGKIGILDGDRIERSNLPRQILYSESDLGQHKTIVCSKKLRGVNSACHITEYPLYLTEENALAIIKNYDIVIDCSDNFATRYLISDACCHLNKINVSASLVGFNGIFTIFPGSAGPCYRCLFETISDETQPNCNEAGVLNTFVGFIALLQAHETVKFILKIGSSVIGKIFTINGLSMKIQQLNLNKNPKCPTCSLKIGFTNLKRPIFHKHTCSNTITYNKFLSMIKSKNTYLLIDVRNESEYKHNHLNTSINIPANKIATHLPTTNKTATIILYCQTGRRSALARDKLLANGYKNVFDIEGGIGLI